MLAQGARCGPSAEEFIQTLLRRFAFFGGGGACGLRRVADRRELTFYLMLDQQTASRGELIVSEAFRLAGIEPKAAGDEQKNERAEQETALAFKARFTEQAFESAIRH